MFVSARKQQQYARKSPEKPKHPHRVIVGGVVSLPLQTLSQIAGPLQYGASKNCEYV